MCSNQTLFPPNNDDSSQLLWDTQSHDTKLETKPVSYFQDALGDSNINYDELIILNEDGSYTYNTPTTSCEAYAIMLHKMK